MNAPVLEQADAGMDPKQIAVAARLVTADLPDDFPSSLAELNAVSTVLPPAAWPVVGWIATCAIAIACAACALIFRP